MVFVLTSLTLSSLINFRREVQSIYFYYFSANNVDKGVNFLKLRTVLLKGVEDMDMGGKDLRANVQKVFHEHAVYGKMFGEIFLPDYHNRFVYEYQKRELDFYREINQRYELNYICQKWMGKSVLDNQAYKESMAKIESKMAALGHSKKNSGYAFACFSSFTAIKKLRENLRT